MYDVCYQWFIIINEPVLKFVSLWTEIFSETCHICNVWLWTNVDQCHGNFKKTSRIQLWITNDKYQRKKNNNHSCEIADEMAAKYENKYPDKTMIRAPNVLKILETSTSIYWTWKRPSS